MEGDLSLLSIPDLLQMICLGGYSRDIHLFEGQTQVGVIAIRNGRVDRCFGYGAWGEAAFFKLVNLRRGRYKVNDAQDMSASDATLTAYSWQELLMEAARQQDEAELAAQTAVANSGRVIPFPTPHASGAASSSEGGAMLRDVSTSAISELQFELVPGFDISSPPSNTSSGLFSIPSVPIASSPASAPVSGSAPSSVVTSVPRAEGPRPVSDTGRHAPVSGRSHSDTGRHAAMGERPRSDTGRHAAGGTSILTAPAPAIAPAPVPAPASSSDSTADDVMNLLQEATACYLRRDLARAEALLQKCLELRPGDKRALQNLDRIRRKKPQ